MSHLSFWLWLTVAFCIVMLVALGIFYWGNLSINAEPNAPIEPIVEVEPNELERIKQSALGQLEYISAVLHRSTSNALKADRTVGLEAPIITRDNQFDTLAEKMHQLIEVTSHLLEKRQILASTAIDRLLTSNDTTPNGHYLFFTLNREPFAVSVLSVDSIVEATQLIIKPSISPKLRQAIRVRNSLVPVIDLGAHLSGRPINVGLSTRIVILEVSSGDRMQMIGVMVDAVGKVLEIPRVEVEPPAPSDSKIHNDFSAGTISVNNRTVTLLDIGRGLLTNEFLVMRS
ncbi:MULTISPECIES: chemotaxis protein CheW [Pseudomonas]|uniref:Chemotaxis protein CheW n=1 Tax=Pseudomonas frederiksbergensis TaxID=104087 RepID=A0A6L5C5U9_9PSED|nr:MULTISPECIES: chemotaxis protein CheW [Pseudomonas]KAA8554017.1 Chemotaxis protein CheW [Pseudomonas marginalis]KAF2394837.1 Chemotaxis protein CheW [Pseudomonas frederiksbergensis]